MPFRWRNSARQRSLVLEKHQTQEKLEALAKGVGGTLEQLRETAKHCQTARWVIEKNDTQATLNFFKSIGSNIPLRDRRLRWEPRVAWQVIVGEGFVEMGETESGSDLARVSAQERVNRIKRSPQDTVRSGLLSLIRQFFLDNPGWE